MGFADRYLQKHSTYTTYIGERPSSNLKGIIAIPAYRESGLNKCLDSLFLMDPIAGDLEIIVLINLPENSGEALKKQHLEIYENALQFSRLNCSKNMKCHVIMDALPAKHFGAGLARKTVMDEAIRRFNIVNKPSGIIFSLDADALVAKNYASTVIDQFNEKPETEGCAIYFEHPVEGTDYPPEVYNAVINYELHQRYYLLATRFTGYPYAFHTVGSCFAVKAESYCRHGGMSRRQAGEDFYFIQKIAMNGNFRECNNTTVYPSPRPSDRVPFGTGPAIKKQLENPEAEFHTFNPDLFVFLKAFYDRIPDFYRSGNPEDVLRGLHKTLISHLLESRFSETLTEIKQNVSSDETFYQRFLRNFNWLWLLKYLHFAEEQGIRKIPVTHAITGLFKQYNLPTDITDKKHLLQYLRQLHISNTKNDFHIRSTDPGRVKLW